MFAAGVGPAGSSEITYLMNGGGFPGIEGGRSGPSYMVKVVRQNVGKVTWEVRLFPPRNFDLLLVAYVEGGPKAMRQRGF